MKYKPDHSDFMLEYSTQMLKFDHGYLNNRQNNWINNNLWLIPILIIKRLLPYQLHNDVHIVCRSERQ